MEHRDRNTNRRLLDIGRGDEVMTSGTVSDCNACGEGSLVVERRNGRVVNSICTNIRCDLNPGGLSAARIKELLRDWNETVAVVGSTVVTPEKLSEWQIEYLADYLFENLRI